ncbi:MAG: tetraacyldisaccharide 4'-kinase [Methylacidiphilales bacterium]|nr:tetraacyldisaccharide 4'-kinase [Candidatus Methylacidiphilales bacterium]MDW8349509.1 tetraacyldisaccharide 4'-kinase [Verrucomicrobiae bacterium]
MQTILEELEQFAIDVILERRYGKRATLLRALLYLLSFPYRWGVAARLWLYRERIAKVHHLGVQVISVGNLTVGGTGKTPIVEMIARLLAQKGRKVAILSRGYRSKPEPISKRLSRLMFPWIPASPPRVVSDGKTIFLDSEKAGDEPYMLARNLKTVPVLVDKDRVKSGLYAIEKFGTEILVLDDGLQYLSLFERTNVVLVDREAPFGNEYVLPRGTLREPHEQMKRADLIIVTKCDGGDTQPLLARLRLLNPHAPIILCRHAPRYLQNFFSDERLPLSELRNAHVGTISGIARPESFEKGVKNLGAKIIYSKQFADHHRFSAQEIERVIQHTHARGGKMVVTTEKDAVRFPPLGSSLLPLFFLRVEIEIIEGKEAFESWMERLVKGHQLELEEIETLLTHV